MTRTNGKNRQTPAADPTQRFTRVKCVEGSEVEIEWTTSPRAAQTETHARKSKDTPHPDFLSAMAAFLPLATALCGFTKSYLDDARVSSIALSYGKDGHRGLVVTIVRAVKETTSPFVIHTPLIREITQDEDAADAAFPEAWDDALTAVLREATQYLAGKTAQVEMFEEAAASA